MHFLYFSIFFDISMFFSINGQRDFRNFLLVFFPPVIENGTTIYLLHTENESLIKRVLE